MKDREILSNAIDKAIANGWVKILNKAYMIKEDILEKIFPVYVYHIIFSHSFLKAFFDKDIYVHWDESNPELEDLKSYKEIPQGEIHLIYLFPEGDYHWYQPLWAYHAQVMILKENPITYLEEYL